MCLMTQGCHKLFLGETIFVRKWSACTANTFLGGFSNVPFGILRQTFGWAFRKVFRCFIVSHVFLAKKKTEEKSLPGNMFGCQLCIISC